MRADPAAYYFAVSHGLRVDVKNLWPSEAPLKENNGRDQISRKKVGAFGARVRLSWIQHMDTLYGTSLHASTLIKTFIE